MSSDKPKCENCNDTGDVHKADGEWLAICTACMSKSAEQPVELTEKHLAAALWETKEDCRAPVLISTGTRISWEETERSTKKTYYAMARTALQLLPKRELGELTEDEFVKIPVNFYSAEPGGRYYRTIFRRLKEAGYVIKQIEGGKSCNAGVIIICPMGKSCKENLRNRLTEAMFRPNPEWGAMMNQSNVGKSDE